MTHTRKPVLVILATALIAALMVTAPMTTVSADSGDGREACNFGEICFHDWTWSDRYRKHFWWSANHSHYLWWDATLNRHTELVQNDANTVRNRDSRCWVVVEDLNGEWPNSEFVVPNDGRTHRLPFGVRNRNDRHLRCG